MGLNNHEEHQREGHHSPKRLSQLAVHTNTNYRIRASLVYDVSEISALQPFK